MVEILILAGSLVLLYFSQHRLSKEFGRIIRDIGWGRKTLIVLWSIIFLPGTVIHELSHFLFAILTGARTGKIEIFPSFLEGSKDGPRSSGSGSTVILGSVQTQRLNPIQGFLIGTAPFLIGIVLLAWISSSFQQNYNQSSFLLLFVQGYLFFTISNSFFPSWADIKQVIPLTIVVSSLVFIVYFLGIKIILPNIPQLTSILNTISLTVFFSSLLNLTVILLLSVVRRSLIRRR